MPLHAYAKFAPCDTIGPVHPTLPATFDSWAQVLTDWKVIGVVNSCARPKCFADHPELAAPFVAEISAAIREKQLRRRPVAVAIERESVTEPTYDRLGGPGYVALRCQMEAAQDRYIHGCRSTASASHHESPAGLRSTMEQFQHEFRTIRRRHEPQVEQARAASVCAFWAAHSARGLSDDFFDDLPFNHSICRVSRVAPAWWWRTCFARLQTRLAKHHAADGCFLDALPSLRANATKKTLAAVIFEWCEARQNEFGWAGPGHYRMLADRAGTKARTVTAWFDQRAPGYFTEARVRESLHAQLGNHLAILDPVVKHIVSQRLSLSAHWRN